MTVRFSLREENLKLHSENARLRKRIQQFESGEEFLRISSQYSRQLSKERNAAATLERRLERERSNGKALRRQKDMAQKRCDELFLENAELREQIAELEARLAYAGKRADDAEAEAEKFRIQLNRDYTNSSISSSRNPNRKKVSNSRTPSDRKRGAQPGHSGHRRRSYTPDLIVTLDPPPETADTDRYYRTGRQRRRQVVELIVAAKVTEYVADEYRDRITGKRIYAQFPKGVVNEVNYGAGVKAAACMLNGYCNVPVRKVREFLSEVSGGMISMSDGKISGLAAEFSAKTEAERADIYRNLVAAPYMNSDATYIRVDGRQQYVIVAANETDVLYYHREHKGIEALRGTPVEDYRQTLVHDHDVSYYRFGNQHQECLAHVLRYLQNSIENEAGLTWNARMKELLQSAIHSRKHGKVSDAAIEQLYREYSEVMLLAEREYAKQPPSDYYRDGYNLYRRLRESPDDYLRFMKDENLPATNNLAERMLRQVKRKTAQTGGFRSAAGVESYCEMLGIIETAKQRNENIYSTLKSGF